MNFFQTVLKYARYINPRTVEAFAALIMSVKVFLAIFDDEPQTEKNRIIQGK